VRLSFGGEFYVASSASVTCVVPSDYAEFYEQFREEIRKLVWSYLGYYGQRADVEDGVSYIFQQFIKNDMLTDFDPSKISRKTGEPVTFRGYAMSMAALYCRGLRTTLQRRQGHVSLWHDPDYAEESSQAGVEDEYPSFDGMGVERLRDALAEREDEPGRAPVLPLFDALAERSAEGRRVSLTAMREKFGLNKEGIELWFADLCAALREVTTHSGYAEPVTSPVVPDGIPQTEAAVPVPDVPDSWFAGLRSLARGGSVFELGGLVLTRDEVAAAAAALRATSGTRVLPAWQNAGHRLAGSGKTWYLDFARQVIEQYPEFDKPKGGHYPGGHGGRVKPALIYGLELLAGTLPADDPVPEPVSLPVDSLWGELCLS
jgi:hypothetical protein